VVIPSDLIVDWKDRSPMENGFSEDLSVKSRSSLIFVHETRSFK